MSTFSSVLRKPGQKITPRAAPRRNVHRQAQKAAAAANLHTLTPESASDTPQQQAILPFNAGGEPLPRQVVDRNERRPSPPTRKGVHPSPPPEPTLDTVQIPSREHSQSVPPVVIEERNTRAGAKRKASVETNSDAATTDTAAEATAREIAASKSAVKPKPNKKRKVAPQGAPSYLLARPQDAAEPVPPPAITPAQSTRSSRRSSSRQSQRAESEIQDLLQRSRTGLSAVSELSRSIDDTARRTLRSRSRRDSTTLLDVQYDNEQDLNFEPKNRMGALASTVLDAAVHPRGRKLHRKGQTTVDPETHEIDPDEVQMGDLTKDSGLGKRSETGKRLDEEWTDIKARWDEVAVKNRKNALDKRAREKEMHQKTKSAIPEDTEINAQDHLQMAVVNGQVVVIQESRVQDFNRDINVVEPEEAQVDEPIYRYVNSNRIGKKAGRIGGPQSRWNEESTNLFYKGLRMFGTDFEMIANILFPSKTRKEIKDKFVREERSNHSRIIECTRQREEINLKELMKENDIGELKDPDTVMQDLEAEEQRLRKQHQEKMAQENGEIIMDDDEADQPIPSIEVDRLEGEDQTIEEEFQPQPPNVEAEPSVARAVESVRPKQRKPRQPRRTTRDTSKAKATRKGKKPLEGVEERIGTIDDVER